DGYVARLWTVSEKQVAAFRKEQGIKPAFRMVDTLHTGKYIPYFYSSYSGKNDSVKTDTKKIVCLGAGPIRIGQGIEFDYSTVHAVKTIKASGYESIIINNNPETVSTDYTTADKLYFDPLTPEDVMNVLEFEGAEGVITSLGGQTAINLAAPLDSLGVTLLGTGKKEIDKAEDRELFDELLASVNIPRPRGAAVTDVESGVKAAAEIGYPLLVRPSFVLGGRAMQIVSKETELRKYLTEAVNIDASHPVLIDKYIKGKEVEVDAICDGQTVFVPGIMELVERTGVHSGDSISVYPSFSLSESVKQTVLDYTEKLGLAIGIKGLFNVQYIVKGEEVYVIEVNPRSSRTVPFLSKSTGIAVADVATKVILGETLKQQGYVGYSEKAEGYFVKVPVFSFHKLRGLDAYLSPEMKSTGEAIGCGATLTQAFEKAFLAAGMKIKRSGTVLLTLADEDKEEALPLIKRFAALGFSFASTGLSTLFLKEKGFATQHLGKPSEGSNEVEEFIRAGKATYVINTRAILSGVHYIDGETIRRAAIESNVQMMTSLDTVRALLSVLDERG
ncbi:MAG TPA: carbamoyl-phosphate synthase large subunit, partial [Clostridiales bacterium]|nr:carbamoyl-phosphate synthase large subunit [Clostridiales bacterium]